MEKEKALKLYSIMNDLETYGMMLDHLKEMKIKNIRIQGEDESDVIFFMNNKGTDGKICGEIMKTVEECWRRKTLDLFEKVKEM